MASGSCCARASRAVGSKVFETLLVLVENRDRVLSKDELLDQVWGGASVEEGGLTRNVSILRKTLGEKPDDHQFIVTVPGRGYRFVAAVNETTVNEPPAEVHGELMLRNGRAEPSAARRWLALAGLAVLASEAPFTSFAQRRPRPQLPRWPCSP